MKKPHSKKSDIPPTQFLVYYEQFADPLFRFVFHKTSDREVAKDITQETFIKAWEYINRGEDIDNMRAFLYRIANNMVIDHYRRHSSSSLNDLTDQGFDPMFENEQDPVARFDGGVAIEMLDLLDPAHKEVILMRYVEELTVREIAKVIGEKENTVSVRLHRALKEIRTIYIEKGKSFSKNRSVDKEDESKN